MNLNLTDPVRPRDLFFETGPLESPGPPARFCIGRGKEAIETPRTTLSGHESWVHPFTLSVPRYTSNSY